MFSNLNRRIIVTNSIIAFFFFWKNHVNILVSPIYWIIKEERTIPKVMVAIVSLRLLSGSDATSAADNATHTPPSTTICLHALAKNIGIVY